MIFLLLNLKFESPSRHYVWRSEFTIFLEICSKSYEKDYTRAFVSAIVLQSNFRRAYVWKNLKQSRARLISRNVFTTHPTATQNACKSDVLKCDPLHVYNVSYAQIGSAARSGRCNRTSSPRTLVSFLPISLVRMRYYSGVIAFWAPVRVYTRA